MKDDAKSLLVLVHGLPLINSILVSILFTILSYQLLQITNIFVDIFIPLDAKKFIHNLLTISGIVFALLSINWVISLLT